MDRKFLATTFTLTGTIIGAGILGLPYVFAKSGMLIGTFWLIILGFILIYVNLYPRKSKIPNGTERRHPAFVKSSEINQIFNYIGFIKRMNNRKYAKYLPMLFQELRRFVRVVEEIIYTPAISISEDIYVELHTGLQNFFDAYQARSCDKDSWVEEIWKNQKQ